ncbi:hypothetical protein SNE40_012128 [Patella caerulea]
MVSIKRYVYTLTVMAGFYVLYYLNIDNRDVLNILNNVQILSSIWPETPVSIPLQDFIFKAEINQSISLTKGCTGCPIICPNSFKNKSGCRGDDCLCFKSNPVLNFHTWFNNTIISKEELLPFEMMTLKDKSVKDPLRLPNKERSYAKVMILTEGGYKVGEDILVKLEVYNGYGDSVKRGGDDVRVRMVEINKQLTIAGRVKDYNNGTYIITIPTLWNGTNNVIIYMPYFREERVTYLTWTRQFNALFYYKAKFRKGSEVQVTLCSSRPNLPEYDVICNMTYENGDDKWYCGAPPSRNLSCRDVISIGDYHFIDVAIANGQQYLRRRGNTFRLFKELKVEVKGEEDTRRHLLPICKRLSRSKTWDTSLPTGYASKGKYFPMYCQINKTDEDIKTCLINTTVIFTGDSTTRHWFIRLRKFIECKQTVGTSDFYRWTRDAECENQNINLKIQWRPHNLPITSVEKLSNEIRFRVKSIALLLDDIPTEGKYIFVIHLFAHFSRHHYYVIRERLRHIAVSLRHALDRNENLFVAVKGPHMYSTDWMPAVNDYTGPFVERVLMNELVEFRNRVAYLDFWDMSSAYGNVDIHPTEPMQWNMLRLLFGYACP